MIDLFSIILVIIVILYVVLLIMVSEYIRSRKRLSPYFTRRIIHLLAGDSIVVLPLFKHVIYPVVITVVLALMIFIGLSKPGNPFSKTMVITEYDKLHVYGPLYYILAIMILVILFYNRPEIVIASTMIMAWGDGFASLIPKYISNPHMIFDNGVRYRKSIEGTLGMFIMGFLGAIIGLFLSTILTGYNFNIVSLAPIILIASIVSSIVEMLSVGPLASFDNLTVPMASSITILILERMLLSIT